MTNQVEVRIDELEGRALDWAVAKVDWKGSMRDAFNRIFWSAGFSPSTDWAQGGPLIEKYRVDLDFSEGSFVTASMWAGDIYRGMTGERKADKGCALTAAMRAIVAAHTQGDTVTVPAELVGVG